MIGCVACHASPTGASCRARLWDGLKLDITLQCSLTWKHQRTPLFVGRHWMGLTRLSFQRADSNVASSPPLRGGCSLQLPEGLAAVSRELDKGPLDVGILTGDVPDDIFGHGSPSGAAIGLMKDHDAEIIFHAARPTWNPCFVAWHRTARETKQWFGSACESRREHGLRGQADKRGTTAEPRCLR